MSVRRFNAHTHIHQFEIHSIYYLQAKRVHSLTCSHKSACVCVSVCVCIHCKCLNDFLVLRCDTTNATHLPCIISGVFPSSADTFRSVFVQRQPTKTTFFSFSFFFPPLRIRRCNRTKQILKFKKQSFGSDGFFLLARCVYFSRTENAALGLQSW